MKRIVWHEASPEERRAALSRPGASEGAEIAAAARAVVEDVRARGDAAVREYTKKFDGAELESAAVPESDIAGAKKACGAEAVRAINAAHGNIRKFHEAQGLTAFEMEVAQGVHCARRVLPLNAVGLYVPGGSAPLVSTTLMLGVPSALAGCPSRVLCTPCGADGKVNPHILYAARLCGIDKIFRIGGAQAIAAMAYGTQSVPKADKIFGPGNAYVTAAKRIVAEDAGGAALDMPAGPSEVLVIADDSTNPAFAAADLLSQAEHDPLSQVVLVALSEEVRGRIAAEAEKQLAALPRRVIAAAAMANSVSIVARDMREALEISNLYAPEHLILCLEGAEEYVDAVTNAGSVFVGPWSTESAGDYCSGTNHVLPTYGYARSYSGLGVEAFQKTMTVQALTREGLAQLGGTITALAGLEGLDAHARAVAIRMEDAA